MAAGGISSGKQRNPRGFMTVLSAAACEWVLILLLFLDAALSYLIAKFADNYELQTPCMLCSRFDRIFGDKRTGCYRSCLCKNHKEEISFQVFCHVHGNLADVRAMCEECLVSFATDNLLYHESNNLMMTKIGNKSFIPSSPGPWTCSCCHKTWRARSSAQRLLQLTSVGFGASKANVKPPLPRAPGRSRFSRRDSLKKIRDKISGPASPRKTSISGVDTLSHVGYTELKITSDSESEIQISDDDDGCSATRGKGDSKSEYSVRHDKGIAQKSGTEASALENQARQSSGSEPSLLDQPLHLAASSAKNVSSRASNDFVGHGLAELDWEILSPKAGPSVLPELKSLDNVPPSRNIPEDPHASGESSKPNTFLPPMSGLSVLSELISATNIASSSTINTQETNLTEANDEGNDSIEKNNSKALVYLDDSVPSVSNQKVQADISAPSFSGKKVSDRLAEPSAISDAVKAKEGSNQKVQANISAPSYTGKTVLDRLAEPSATSDAVKAEEGSNRKVPANISAPSYTGETVSDRLAEPSAISDAVKAEEGSNRKVPADISAPSYTGETVSDRFAEPSAISDAVKSEEGMKSLPQLSTAEVDVLQTASLKNYDDGDDHKKGDFSSSDGVHMLQKSTFSDRDDSGSEPSDAFSISEIEGESIVDRLKRRVEHDQRSMNALYKELEEERSASAIAANQAMAMITRLQEEKAALHMEALQYLRMMEEQAEYDMEALERANDLLAEREKELQDLEAELEVYRNNDELAVEDPPKENKNLKGEKVATENKLSDNSDAKTIEVSKICEKPKQFNNSICNFEDEKLCISQHLKNLEKKLLQVSDNVQNGGYSERIKKDVDDQVKKQNDNGRSSDSQQEENSLSTRNDFSKSNGGPIDKPADSAMEDTIVSEESNHLDTKHKKVTSLGGEVDVVAFGNEISELNGRLQALENDCNFLMYAFNSLQNGHDGIQFIEEIAHQLQDIRKIVFKKR